MSVLNQKAWKHLCVSLWNGYSVVVRDSLRKVLVEVVEIKILGNPSVAPLAVDGGDDGLALDLEAQSSKGQQKNMLLTKRV